MRTPLYIFDLDGTLADIKHRRHFVEGPGKKDWDSFFEACVDDLPIKPVINLLNIIAEEPDSVRIFSGRSEAVRNQTVRWLCHHVGWRPPLKMRPVGNYEPDDVLKERWLLDLSPVDRERLVGVFDDRDRLVKMWRRHGLICYQVAEGDF